MNIGQRIKQRREELGMSQEELAKKAGYKSRSSINKIEVDGRGLPQSKIALIAKALDTTPSYLMGWKDIKPDYVFTLPDGCKIIIEYMEPENQKKTKRLLAYYFALNEIGQKKALENIEDLSKIYSKDYLIPQAAHERTDIEVTDDMKKHDDDIMDDDAFWNK